MQIFSKNAFFYIKTLNNPILKSISIYVSPKHKYRRMKKLQKTTKIQRFPEGFGPNTIVQVD